MDCHKCTNRNPADLTQHSSGSTLPAQRERRLSPEVENSKRQSQCGIVILLLCSSSGSPVVKAHPLECRSRTPRNTDGLVSLSALPLNDLRGEIRQEKQPGYEWAESDLCAAFVWTKCECICVYTFVMQHMCRSDGSLFSAYIARCLQGCVYSFMCLAWLTVCVPSNVRVSKQDTGESIHLGCRAQFAVAAQ